ncbi:hypothetical protein BU26DRAFT_185090 [Trematosphaeria pertusa]|uniref:Metal tolerance protein 3 n=1 Tax=Trematosphaeria pertusa TaxID=390896 RepID=A0A6A6HT35_9PLEO|nr:uncharacterized protein BU26DRAFT_185090 [Trematosphaeria pertusa]KAF2240962.1 hypothetical protein BU26DRAFT_185090 [Trematosphaeria pertusa]
MQFFAKLVVLLSACHLAVAATEKPAAQLEVRQTTTTTTGADPCLDYGMTANMSVVGANSSYRSVFLAKSNVGTIYNARMFSAAIAKLPALTANTALNNQCGNLTQVALTEAEKNLTQGIVAQFTTAGLPVGIKAGPEVVVIVAAICAIFSWVWVFSG